MCSFSTYFLTDFLKYSDVRPLVRTYFLTYSDVRPLVRTLVTFLRILTSRAQLLITQRHTSSRHPQLTDPDQTEAVLVAAFKFPEEKDEVRAALAAL